MGEGVREGGGGEETENVCARERQTDRQRTAQNFEVITAIFCSVTRVVLHSSSYSKDTSSSQKVG